MKRGSIQAGLVIFFLVCALLISFLSLFTSVDSHALYLTWQAVGRIEPDGSVTALPDEYDTFTDGKTYRFTAEVTDTPDDGYLVLGTAGAAFTIRFNGQELFSSSSGYTYDGTGYIYAQAKVPLPAGESGTVELDCCILEPSLSFSPPLTYLTTERAELASDFGYANWYGIPTGAFALSFAMVFGLFLLGALTGKPDWPLLTLLFAVGLLMLRQISFGQGYYFLPASVYRVFSWGGISWIIPILLLLYLFLRRSSGALRLLARISIPAAAALLAAILLSYLRGSYLFRYLRDGLFPQLQSGYYSGLLYWLTVYLVAACTGISIYGFAASHARKLAEAQTLAVRNSMMLKNYEELSEKNQKTAVLRHEWQNQLMALRLLQQTGDLEGIGAHLDALQATLRQATPIEYTRHPALNALLQSVASRAEAEHADFSCQVFVPQELHIDESDLCTLLLNMLNNALEAVQKLPEPQRHISCQIRFTQGFLAISCENRFHGDIFLDASGLPVTTKSDPAIHGYGLKQMRSIAEKYHSIISFQYTEGTFIVQTALGL